MRAGSAVISQSQSHSQQQCIDDRHVNVIRDANACAMTVKGRKMWCVIWCDRGWRIRMPVLLQIVIWRLEMREREREREGDWVGMTDVVVTFSTQSFSCIPPYFG
jgi:hypothetical protein